MHRREHWSERELSGCAPREVRVLTEGSQLLTAKMGRKLLCIAFRGMERFTATRGRPHIGQMKRMWHMAVVAVLTRTLDRIAQAGWTCHGSSRLRLSLGCWERSLNGMVAPLAGIGDSGPDWKGSKDGLESDITVGFGGRVEATPLKHIGAQLINVGGSFKKEMVVKNVS